MTRAAQLRRQQAQEVKQLFDGTVHPGSSEFQDRAKSMNRRHAKERHELWLEVRSLTVQ